MGTLRRSASNKRVAQLQAQNTKPIMGYTLIELLVVMAIIASLSTMLIGFSKQSSKQLELATKESQILSLISHAKFLTIELSLRERNPTPGFHICGYGVLVPPSRDRVLIFQHRVQSPGQCSDLPNEYSSNDAKLTGDLNLVKIDKTEFSISGTLDNVLFIPPDPDVYINGGADSSAYVDIGLVDTTSSFRVVVTDAGQVRAE